MRKQDAMQLSIITPTYNSIVFIEKCLQNVIEQDCDLVEHIIIDGGSTDGTLAILKKYAANYNHIRWVSESDNGQSSAMNKGIDKAKSDCISFLNVDDLYFPFILKRICSLFNDDSSLSFVVGNCKVVNTEGQLLYINRPKRIKDYHLFSYKEPFPINPCAYFYKKSIHNVVGLYNEENHYNMDYEFILRASLYFNLQYFEEDWGVMLHHEDAKTAQDFSNGQLLKRKRNVFDKVYSEATWSIKIKASLYKLLKKVKK